MQHHHRIAETQDRIEEKVNNNIEFREQFIKNKHAVAEWRARMERDAKVVKAQALGTARIQHAKEIKAAMSLQSKDKETFWAEFTNKRFEEVQEKKRAISQKNVEKHYNILKNITKSKFNRLRDACNKRQALEQKMRAAEARKNKIMEERAAKLQQAEAKRLLALVNKGDRSQCFEIFRQKLVQGQNPSAVEFHEELKELKAWKVVEPQPEEEKVQDEEKVQETSSVVEEQFIKPAVVFSKAARVLVQKKNAVSWAIVNPKHNKDPQSDSDDDWHTL